MIALYRPGVSVLHRAPAGIKLLLIGALIAVVSAVPRSPWVLAGAAALLVLGYLLAGLGWRELARQAWLLRWLLAFTILFQLLFVEPAAVAQNAGRILVVVMLAALITLTTRTTELLDTLGRALEPLRRIGINATRVSLLLTLTITVIPVIASFAGEIRDALRARGIPARPTTFIIPLLVASMRYADELSDALTARGLDA
ncbi:energy-coupling factor transporter transmembrane component T family protein [Mycetocola spongiae]|uniref:energy-coupling factor transporter transmembrane component T family protein n=1 Tax=Mycetocola spongiae TaxID=2859226 RepID=UPI001CF45083|nr:energy-coupling factor transporter transmembrane protein EcfT [Mycetocola spongiae]UCR88841.1 energy-coupling factor transporter transmembrane protein EcfT [Mycetocola spongiae]